MSQPRTFDPSGYFDIAILMLLAGAATWLGWIGYHGVDDLPYAIAANEWITQGPHVGTNHWALRYPHILPIGLSFAAFGVTDFSLVLPTIVYFLGLVVMTYLAMRRLVSRAAAFVAALLVATTPGFANGASVANPELAEVFFVSLSVWLFLLAHARQATGGILFVAGLAAGLAWLTRETAAGLLIVYFLCFLLRYRYPRSQYLLLAAGFICVVGLETLVLGFYTGDPLYRLHTDLAHVECTPPDAVLLVRNEGQHWLTVPLRILAGDGNHILIYLVAIGGAVIVFATPRLSQQQRIIVLIFIGLGLLHLFLVGYVLGLRLTRYYLVLLYAAVVLIGIGLTVTLEARRFRPLLVVIVIAIVLSSLVTLVVKSGDRMFGARTVAAYVMDHGSVVYTNRNTRAAATFFLLEHPELTRLIRSDSPPYGALYFYDAARYLRVNLTGRGADAVANRHPERWTEIRRADPNPTVGQRLVDGLKLQNILPAKTAAWMQTRRAPVMIYRVSAVETADAAGDAKEAIRARPERCDPWLQVR